MDLSRPHFQIRNRRGNYTCACCGTKYSRIDHLRRHEQAHENGKRHRCQFCGKAFNRQDVLDRHRVQVHKTESFLSSKRTAEPNSAPPSFHERHTHRSSVGRDTVLPLESSPAFSPESWLDPNYSPEDTGCHGVLADSLYVSENTDNSMPDLDRQHTVASPNDPMTDEIQLKRARLIFEKPDCTIGELFDLVNADVRSSSIHRSAEPQPSARLESEPIRLMNHRLNVIERESLFAFYRKDFLIPFVHLSSIDSLATSCDGFSDVERPHRTHSSSPAPFPQALLYAILAHGAVFVRQPELARTLYASANKMLLREFAALARRQATKVPLPIVQTMVHQAIFGLSFGDPSLESDSERLMRSLAALILDNETTETFLGLDVSTPTDCAKPRTYWIQREEAKRAIYVIFWLLSACTLRLNHAPIISLSHIKAELPCSEVLWKASSSGHFDVGGQESHLWSGFSELYTSNVEPSNGCNASTFASPLRPWNMTGDKASSLEPEAAEDIENGGSLSEFRFLILVAAVHSQVWTWYVQHPSSGTSTEREERARPLQSAVYRLRGMCPNFQSLVPGSEGYKYLVNAVNVLDNSQLLLNIDLRAMKEVLLSRQFEKLNTDAVLSPAAPESVGTAGIQAEPDTNDGTESFPEQETLFRTDSELEELDAAAIFSATALVSSAKTGKWWNSNGSWDLHLPSAIMAFSFIQTLIDWALSRMETMDCLVDSISFSSTIPLYSMFHDELVKLWEYCSFINTPPVRFETPKSFTYLLLIISNSYAAFYRGQSTWPVLEQLAQGLDARVSFLSGKYFASFAPRALS